MPLSRIPHVEQGDVYDVEPGCCAWSKTITTSGGFPLGGIVASIGYGPHDRPMDANIVIWNGSQPTLQRFPLDDLDAETMTFFAANASKDAQRIHAYLSRLKAKDRRGAAMWSRIAADLADISASGQYTPQAEARYRANFSKHTTTQEDQS